MQQAERMRRRTPWYVFVIVLVVAALVASAFLWARPDPGPLEPPLGRSSVVIAARVGQPVTGAAMNLVAYQGDGEVVFDSVEAVGATPGIRVLGYRVVLPTGNGIVGSAREWPPSGYELHGVAGFAYTAEGPTPQIVVGVEASRQGRSGIDGFRLRYHVGGQQYVVSYAQAVQVCVPGC